MGVPVDWSSVVSEINDPIYYCHYLQCYHLARYYSQADARVQESAVVAWMEAGDPVRMVHNPRKGPVWVQSRCHYVLFDDFVKGKRVRFAYS